MKILESPKMKIKLIVAVLISMLVSCSVSKESKKKGETYKFLVGDYSKKGAEGVYFCEFNPTEKSTKIISHSPELEDPSFLAISADQKHVYAICETKGGSVKSFGFDEKTGSFTFKNMVSSGGAHPCYITLDKTGKWAFTGNYTGGSLAVLPVKADGSLEEPSQIIQHVGSGPNKSRQEKPHVHSVNISPDNKNLYVADLGTDIVTNYAFDEATGKLSKVQEISVKAGSGPRHVAFHPNLPLMYVIQEMAGIITQFSVKDGMLTKVEEVSTLPKDFKGENSCADIHFSPDGKFLYGSNRFYDMIVTFAVDEQTGKLTQLSQTSVKGKVPRNFGITPDGKYLLVANQETDNIVIFERDAKTGALKDLNLELEISMPVCIKFLK